jgi:hypothetical protein
MEIKMAYTVLNFEGTVQERGADLQTAAHTVMSYDGHEFEIIPEKDGYGYRLWTSQFSRNSCCWRGLTKSVIFSLAKTKATAEIEIYQQVIARADYWKGCTVMTDGDYAAMIAESHQ